MKTFKDLKLFDRLFAIDIYDGRLQEFSIDEIVEGADDNGITIGSRMLYLEDEETQVECNPIIIPSKTINDNHFTGVNKQWMYWTSLEDASRYADSEGNEKWMLAKWYKPFKKEPKHKEKTLNVGDTFKLKGGRKEYQVVSIFNDNGETYYVAKTKVNNIVHYSNVFWFDNGELKQNV